MPVVLRKDGYRFGFYASDIDEPPHVHVERERKRAKFWLEPAITLQSNHGFRPHELNAITKIIYDHYDELLESWHEFFPDRA